MGSREGPTMRAAQFDGKVMAERLYGRANGSTSLTAGGNGKSQLPLMRELSSIHSDDVELHPLLDSFPPWTAYETAQFAEDIRAAGGTAPFLVMREGRRWLLIDEKNRFSACKMAKLPIRFEQWQALDSLAETVARLNVPRSHLTDSQLAAVAVPIAEELSVEGRKTRALNLRQGKSGPATKTAISEKWPDGLKLGPQRKSKSCSFADGGLGSHEKAAAKAAEICHVSRAYVNLAQKIYREDRELFEQVRLAKLNLNQAKLALGKKDRASRLTPAPSPGFSRGQSDPILTGDCMKLMPKLEAGFPLIFADPPYNNGFPYDADPTGDRLRESYYLAFIKKAMAECARLLTPNGSMFWLIDDRWSDWFGIFLRQVKPSLHRRQTIYWWENFAQNQKTRFTCEVRSLHYFTRSAYDFTWNADDIRIPSARQLLYADGRARRGQNSGQRLADRASDRQRRRRRSR